MSLKSNTFTLGYKVIAKIRLPQLLHRMLFSNQLTIVMYHAVVRSPLKISDRCFVDEYIFRNQLNYLRRYFEIINLSEAIERMRRDKVHKPTAVITFDDGYQNNYDIVFPILLEARIPATIFLNTGFVNTNDTVWFCRLNHALSKTSMSSFEWDGYKFDLSDPKRKTRASEIIQERLKELPDPQLMDELRSIFLYLGYDPYCPIENDSPFRMLNDKSIAEMANSGLIEFGAHTHYHTILSYLSPMQQYSEIEQSIISIQKLTGRPCKLFSYPNGRIKDYDMNTIKALEALGIRAAVTAIAGPNNRITPAMELRRYSISADLNIARFQLLVHHSLALFRRMNR